MGSGTKQLDRETRFRIAIQRNRAAVYTLACSLALLFRGIGYFKPSYVDVIIILAAGDVSALVIWALCRARLPQRFRIGLDPVWIAVDILSVSFAVSVMGGSDSIVIPWYLVNISAAAFVMGQAAAAVTALLCTICLISVLVLLGQISGFDATFFRTVGLMVNLYAASFFFLRAVTGLQRKTRQVRELREEERKSAEELAEANLRLIEADRVKSRFLASMSHELRTPLNAIIGFSEVLIGHFDGRAEKRFVGFLRNIHASGKHLLSLISDILDLSKIEAGKMELFPESLSVASTIDDVCAITNGMARERSVSIDIDTAPDLPRLQADQVRLKQILFNLLSNAIKFSPRDSAVSVVSRRLTGERSPLGIESIQISVIDRGIGVSPRDREIIFEEFRQADLHEPSRRVGGTGLGLALVKRFVELHRGVISVISVLGEGSTFSVTLPLVFQGKEALEPSIESQPPGTGSLILVVEDDRVAFERIAGALTTAGFDTVWCQAGESAVSFASRLRPAAIILDIVMPGTDGFEALKQIKSQPEIRDIPVLIVSMLPNRDLGIALGAADYINKPFDPESLIRRLSQLVPASREEHPRVLVIDDDRMVHELMDEVLGSRGYEVLHAYSGEEGLRSAGKNAHDVIILDLLMEGMDGFGIAHAIDSDRSDALGSPIIVFTAKDLNVVDHDRLRGKIAAVVNKADGSSRLIESLVDVLRQPSGRTKK
ncbi:MAG TPA: response regulator [Thermoanaerobaculia bacterium]|nr:response regulator [Thermoanaerobaculia bacterium]